MRLNDRKIPRRRLSGARRAIAESLEVRRLFVIDLTLTAGTLFINEESPGVTTPDF